MIPTKTSNRLNTGRDLPPTSELIAMYDAQPNIKKIAKSLSVSAHRVRHALTVAGVGCNREKAHMPKSKCQVCKYATPTACAFIRCENGAAEGILAAAGAVWEKKTQKYYTNVKTGYEYVMEIYTVKQCPKFAAGELITTTYCH